jgi:flagellin
MVINHNIASLNTYRQLEVNSNHTQRNIAKLSSGLRINNASDDAAGLSISEKMRAQIRGLDQASRNAQDGISMVQTAEGALNETQSILQRMRELSVQGSSDTNDTGSRSAIQAEMNQLTNEVNRIGNTTDFNTQKLLNGDKDSTTAAVAGVTTFTDGAGAVTIDGQTIAAAVFTASGAAGVQAAISGNATLAAKYTSSVSGSIITLTQKAGKESATAAAVAGAGATAVTVATAGSVAGAGVQLQIGANQNQSLTIDIGDMRAKMLGISASVSGTAGFTSGKAVTDGTNNTKTEFALDVSSATNAAKAITTIQSAIDKVSSERSKLGAYGNRLDHTINNLGTSSENLTAAESRIRDVDMAKEMTDFTKNNILSQAAQAMLAQANQQPQGVLQLLR